jgi:putative transposase
VGTKPCQDFGADLCEFNGEERHVHLLVHHPRTVAITRLLQEEGAGRAGLPERLWSPFYFANPVGGGPLSVGLDYVNNQKRPT